MGSRAVQPRVDSTFVPAIPTIAGTAAGLGNDVDAIYRFVANNIQFIPTFGVQKGALACLIDGYGNSFDQSALMVALLQAAGYNAQFLYGQIQIDAALATSWLNATDPGGTGTILGAYFMLSNGGANPFIHGMSNTLAVTNHVWVQVDVTGAGNWFVFDPSMKSYSVNPGIDLATVAGYDPVAFQSACLSGTTQTADSVQSLNTVGLQTQLQTMTTSVQSWIAANNPEATIADIIGGRSIIPVTGQVRNTSLSYQYPSSTPMVWTAIPSTFFTTLRVQCDPIGSTYAIDATFNSHDLAASRLTLMPNSSNEFVLLLDKVPYGISTVKTATSMTPMLLTVTHPFADPFVAGPPNKPFPQLIKGINYYLIGNSWGSTGPYMGYIRRQLLQDNITAGGVDADDDMIGESLLTLWHHWSAQKTAAAEMVGQFNYTTALFYHQIGLVGQSNLSGSNGPLTDLGGISWLTAANDGDYTRQQPSDLALGLRGISFEAGTIEQVPGVGGVSSNTMLNSANTTAVATVGGTNHTGDTLTITVNDPALSGGTRSDTYTVKSTDTLRSIALGLISLINADSSLAAIGVTSPLGGVQGLTIGGTVTAGDTLTITVHNTALSGGTEPVAYTVLSTDTLASIASGFASLINADLALAAIGVTANAIGAQLSICCKSFSLTTLTTAKSTGATETITTTSQQMFISSTSINQTTYSTSTSTGATETLAIAFQKIFVANSTNWATGSNIQTEVLGYSGADLSSINGYITGGNTVVLHQYGITNQADYTGYGFYVYQPGTKLGSCRGIITGGLSGAEAATPLGIAGTNTNSSVNMSVPDNLDRLEVGEKTEAAIDFVVDHYTGNLSLRHTDVVSGGREFPYGLSFTRFFNNKNVGAVTECGRAWLHNFYMTATIASDPYSALGTQTAGSAVYNALGTLVAVLQLKNNFNLGGSNVTSNMGFLMSYMSASQIAKLLTNNVVNISMGDRTYTFTQLSDGTYAPPKGVSMTLVKDVDHFVMETFDGIQYAFTNWALPTTRIASITYPSGVVVSFTYMGTGPEFQLETVSNGLGRSLTLAYTFIGGLVPYLKSVTAGDGRAANYTFDTVNTGNLTSTTDAGGIPTSYTYDSKNRLLSYLRSGSYSVTYNDQNQVLTMTNPAYVTGFTYARAGTSTSSTGGATVQASASGGPNGEVTTNFNTDGQPTSVISGSDVTAYEYDTVGRVLQQTMPFGDVISFGYDQFNRVLTKIHGPQSESYSYSTGPGSASWNKWTTYADLYGKIWGRTYDGVGNLTSETDPEGGVKNWGYGAFGLLTSYSDPTLPTAVFTTYTNQTSGEVTGAIVDPGTGAHLNLSSGFGYNSTGDKTSETNPRSNTTAYLYNSSRWRIQSTEPAPFGLETGYGYDLIGNQTSTSRQTGGFPAGQATATSYSTLNKPLQIVDPLGHPTSFGYDVFGRRISTVDAENHLRQYILDGNGRLSQLIDANGVAEETRGLYPGGPVHTIADARGNTSTFFRDGIARLTQITYPDSTTEIWTLDGIGNVSSLQTRGSKTIGQTFDRCSRVLTRSPQGQPVVSYSYDFAGRLLTASTPVVSGDASSGSFSRIYDSAGRLISETDSQGAVIGYQLDGNGNVTRITYPSGYYVTRAYDQLDRVTKITLYTDTTPAATFTYDGLDRRLALNFPKTGGETAYSFDIGNNRLSTDIVSGSTSLGLSYQYNNVNQMIDKKTSDSTYEWLLSTAASITYGAASNLNAYPTVGGVTQTYDSDGRLTNDGSFTYIYNTEGMLTQVQNAAGSAVVANYFYDPFKRQVQKTVISPSSVTRYVYSGSQLMEEYNCSGGLPGVLIRRYVYASPGEAIFQIDSSGNVTYLLNDHQGSLIAQANASGNILNQYTYSPFGENTGLPGSVIGYTGQRYDSETGLYYYKARHYKPSIGRFLQPDQIGYGAGMNLYGYLHNDPVNRTDSAGTTDETWLQKANTVAGYIVDGFANDKRIHQIIDAGGSIVGFSHESLLKGVIVGGAAAAARAGDGDVGTHRENTSREFRGDGLDSSHSVSQNQSKNLGIDPKETATMKMDPDFHQTQVPKNPNGTAIEETYAQSLRAHAKYAASIGRENEGNIIKMIQIDAQQPAIRDVITKLILRRL
jgi:RHS repeat-associated protein